MTSVKPAAPGYLAEAIRGQELLEQGRTAEAIETFETALEGMGAEASYGRGVVLDRLGRALLLAGDHERALDRFREALDLAGHLAPTTNVRRLRCALRSGMGDALRSADRPDEARRAYLAALEIARELHDPRSQGVDQARLGALALARGDPAEAVERYRDSLNSLRELKEPQLEAVAWHQLGRVFRQLGEWEEADRHLREAARLREGSPDPVAADQTWLELVELHRGVGRAEAAEQWCRRAVAAHRRSGPSLRLARWLVTLAELLGPKAAYQGEAGDAARQALAVAQSLDPAATEAWAAYGVLGEIHQERGDFRELARRGPAITAAAARVGPSPSLGRVMLLARLARCFAVGDRPDLAVAYLREAVQVAEQIPAADGLADLLAMVWAELGEVLAVQGRSAEAAQAFRASLDLAERSKDLEGVARNRERLGEAAPLTLEGSVSDDSALAITIVEETVTDYAFDPNLLLDGPRTRRVVPPAGELPALPDGSRPVLVPGTRTWLDPQGSIRFAAPDDEPSTLSQGTCTLMWRTSRDVAVRGDAGLVWRLLGALDGKESWHRILAGLPEADRPIGTELVRTLASAGLIDLSGRPWGRFLHRLTKKGVLPAGGLEGDEAMRLAAAGAPSQGDRPRIPIGTAVPDGLRPFHSLTRSRRSTREYSGGALRREEFDALLSTACGATGSLRWSDGELKLRAYPSSGALYAVGIYPVVFRVESLHPAVYRFDPDRHSLEVHGPALDPAEFVHAALPMEREMVAGVAAMFCLSGLFPRHERKYGEGGYRMLVAEAGHVSQNLVLAATGLGLGARPFGGVFDGLINRALGLDETREAFLLSVVVGR